MMMAKRSSWPSWYLRFLAGLILIILVAGGSAFAHPNLQDTLWIQFEPNAIHMAVNVSEREILVAQQSSSVTANTLDRGSVIEKQGDYVLSHLLLFVDGKPLAGAIKSITPPASLADPESTFFQYEIYYPTQEGIPKAVTFLNLMLQEWPYSPGQSWNVSYVMRTKDSRSAGFSSWLLPFQKPLNIETSRLAPAELANDQNQIVPAWRTICDYLHHGVMHILTGYDHLLFLSALVIATASFLEMVEVIIAFTIAHTLTLTLCVFGIFRLPPWIVEPIISLSIIFVAFENAIWPQRTHSWVRLGVAFGFGLIHGLGFAGGLLDAMKGLPNIGIWLALIGFSLGVEIGNQLVALPLYGVVTLVHRHCSATNQIRLIRFGSIIIMLCGFYYFCIAIKEQYFG